MAAQPPAAPSGALRRFAAWQAHRYGNLAAAPFAALPAVTGAGLTLRPDGYTTALYVFVFAVIPALPVDDDPTIRR